MIKYSECTWPYDSDAAKTIYCLLVKAPHGAKLYVWKQQGKRYWQFTMSAGPNSERSMTGMIAISQSLLDNQGAVDAAIAYCKQYRIWNN